MAGGYAWVTLATNDSYSLGALVLARSLQQVGTKQQLAVLVTPGVTNAMRTKLNEVFNVVMEVNLLDSKDEANLRLLKRPELGVTFTKLHCWRLTQFEKCVFLDADTLVLENCDELFDREEFSAAPDIGWPDCFNSGVFVFRPSNDTYEKLIQFALEKGSFDGGDQGLLNLYFSDWAHKDISKHLPFIYNMSSTACYSYLPAFKQFGKNAKIIHFLGASKPWLQYFDTETRKVHASEGLKHLQDILQYWWNIFCNTIHPGLSSEMSGLAGAFAKLTLGAPRTPEQAALDDHLRRQGWEVGNIDYLGRDSFDNIWNKICQTLASVPEQPPPKTESPRVESKPSEVPPAEVKSDEKADLKSEVQQQTSSLAPESAQQVVAPQKAEAEELLSAAASAAAPSIESAPVPPVSSVPVTSESVAPVSTTPVTSESVSPRPVIAPTTPPVATVPTTPPVTPSAVTPAPAVVPVPATPTTAATLASKTSSEVTPAPVPISSASVTSALSSSSINAPPVTPVPISGTSQVPECSKLLEGTKSVPAATDTALKKSSEAVPDSKDSKPVLSAQAPPKTKITEATPPTTPVSPSKETKPALGVETVQAQEPSAPIPTPRKSSKSDKKTGTKTKK